MVYREVSRHRTKKVSVVPNIVALRFDKGSSSSGSGACSTISVYICSHVDIVKNVVPE